MNPNVEDTTFAISTVVQIVIYVGGLIAMWFTLKNKVNLLKSCVNTMTKKQDADVAVIHKRIDKTNANVDTKTDEITKKLDGLQKEVHQSQITQEKNKNEILQAIAANK